MHLYVCFFNTFVCVFGYMFFSYKKHAYMRVFFINLYACLYVFFCHTFVWHLKKTRIQMYAVHNEAVISVGCGQLTSTSIPFCDSPSLSVATCWWLCDTLSSVATSVWEHPVWRLAVASCCWSIVRCRLGLMMWTAWWGGLFNYQFQLNQDHYWSIRG